LLVLVPLGRQALLLRSSVCNSQKKKARPRMWFADSRFASESVKMKKRAKAIILQLIVKRWNTRNTVSFVRIPVAGKYSTAAANWDNIGAHILEK